MVGKRLRRRRLLARLGLRAPEEIDADAVAAPAVPGEVAVELRRVYAVIDSSCQPRRESRWCCGGWMAWRFPQIADRMGLSLSTVKRRLKAAEEYLERSRKP